MEFRTFDVRKILSFDWRGFAPSPHQKKRNLYKEYYHPIHLKNAVILHKSQPIYINPIIIQRGLRTQSQLQVITLKTLRTTKVICKRLINTHNQVGILKLNFIFSFSFRLIVILYIIFRKMQIIFRTDDVRKTFEERTITRPHSQQLQHL